MKSKPESFEDKWIKATDQATSRFKTDESLKMLIKKHEDLAKRLRRAEIDITTRRNKIFMEELKKLL